MPLSHGMWIGFIVVLLVLIWSSMNADMGAKCYNKNKTFELYKFDKSYFGYSLPAPIIIPVFGMIILGTLAAGSAGYYISNDTKCKPT